MPARNASRSSRVRGAGTVRPPLRATKAEDRPPVQLSEETHLVARLRRAPERVGPQGWEWPIEAELMDAGAEERGDLLGVGALPSLAHAPARVVDRAAPRVAD